MRNPDVIVIGSGHNGLIAGAYLAKAGQSVLVLEGNERLGGGAITSELVTPGFKHDWHSATHIVIQANPLLRSDELGLKSKFGLKYVHPDAIFSTVFDDHDHLITYGDVERTCESIAKISPQDADAYRSFARHSAALLPLMVHGMFVPPPPQGAFWAMLDGSAEGRALMQIMQRSMLEVVNEQFSHEKVKVHLLKFAAEMLVGPDEKGTGLFIFNMPGFVHTYPPGVPVGGSGALIDALARCLEHHGAELRTHARVARVLIEAGRVSGIQLEDGEKLLARRAVIGQIHPWNLADVVPGLDAELLRNARSTKTAALAVMASHYALREPPKLHADAAAGRVALMNFAPASLERYLRIFDDVRYGDLPRDVIMAAHNNAQWDPSRAPTGGATLTSFGFGPFQLRQGGSAGWDTRKSEIAKQQRDLFARFCSNFDDRNILGEQFHSPLDMQRQSATFQRGDVGGIGKFFHQIGGHRPTPELAQYAVPGAQGLYLAGTFMHPPGGITGGGRATAVRMFEDLELDFDRVCENQG